LLTYKYYNQSDPHADKLGYVTVRETTPTLLASGWNLVTREILGTTRTLLIYGDNVPPTFIVNPKLPTAINQADLDNGSTFVVEGDIVDDSFGTVHFRQSFKLNDAQHVSALQTDATGSFVILTFTIKDFAGNSTNVHLRLDVSPTAILLKDIGRKHLPTIQPSITLKALLDPS
jgi:hypothetical protein